MSGMLRNAGKRKIKRPLDDDLDMECGQKKDSSRFKRIKKNLHPEEETTPKENSGGKKCVNKLSSSAEEKCIKFLKYLISKIYKDTFREDNNYLEHFKIRFMLMELSHQFEELKNLNLKINPYVSAYSFICKNRRRKPIAQLILLKMHLDDIIQQSQQSFCCRVRSNKKDVESYGEQRRSITKLATNSVKSKPTLSKNSHNFASDSERRIAGPKFRRTVMQPKRGAIPEAEDKDVESYGEQRRSITKLATNSVKSKPTLSKNSHNFASDSERRIAGPKFRRTVMQPKRGAIPEAEDKTVRYNNVAEKDLITLDYNYSVFDESFDEIKEMELKKYTKNDTSKNKVIFNRSLADRETSASILRESIKDKMYPKDSFEALVDVFTSFVCIDVIKRKEKRCADFHSAKRGADFHSVKSKRQRKTCDRKNSKKLKLSDSSGKLTPAQAAPNARATLLEANSIILPPEILKIIHNFYTQLYYNYFESIKFKILLTLVRNFYIVHWKKNTILLYNVLNSVYPNFLSMDYLNIEELVDVNEDNSSQSVKNYPPTGNQINSRPNSPLMLEDNYSIDDCDKLMPSNLKGSRKTTNVWDLLVEDITLLDNEVASIMHKYDILPIDQEEREFSKFNVSCALEYPCALPSICDDPNFFPSVFPPVSDDLNVSPSVYPPVSDNLNVSPSVFPPVSDNLNVSPSVFLPVSDNLNVSPSVFPPVSDNLNVSPSVFLPVSDNLNVSPSVFPSV